VRALHLFLAVAPGGVACSDPHTEIEFILTDVLDTSTLYASRTYLLVEDVDQCFMMVSFKQGGVTPRRLLMNGVPELLRFRAVELEDALPGVDQGVDPNSLMSYRYLTEFGELVFGEGGRRRSSNPAHGASFLPVTNPGVTSRLLARWPTVRFP